MGMEKCGYLWYTSTTCCADWMLEVRDKEELRMTVFELSFWVESDTNYRDGEDCGREYILAGK